MRLNQEGKHKLSKKTELQMHGITISLKGVLGAM